MSFQTSPLAKSVATGEGILIYATNVVLVVASVLPHGLSWTQSGIYLTALNCVHAISRTALKAAAVNKGLGLPPVPVIDPVDPAVIKAIIEAGEGVVAGTPAKAEPAPSTEVPAGATAT